MARKDNRGRNLKTGESQRKDGLYMYRYKDERTGRRLAVYSPDLAELRRKEKEINKDLDEGLLTDTEFRSMTLNDLFQIHLDTTKLAESTKKNYCRMWDSLVKNDLGQMKAVQVRPSHVRLFYSKLSKQKYAHNTIKYIHNMIHPSFEIAVEDDIIRKNPAKRALGDYGEPVKKRTALTLDQQRKLLAFVRDHENFAVHLPMLQIMIGTGLRCGELIGLTWKDVDMKKRTVSVDHQLTYKNYGDGCNFHKTLPKTQAGIRVIPMSKMVGKAFETQRRLNFQLGIPRDIEIDGLSDFIFMSRSGRPMMPSSVNFILRDIVKTYNQEERERAKRERRKPEEMPHISAHILRHTACTRMAETDLDIKVGPVCDGTRQYQCDDGCLQSRYGSGKDCPGDCQTG